jgi:hypothetical protein
MDDKDKSYRFRLSTELFEMAQEKAKREDLALAQVLRRFLRAWTAGLIELPASTEGDGEKQQND